MSMFLYISACLSNCNSPHKSFVLNNNNRDNEKVIIIKK